MGVPNPGWGYQTSHGIVHNFAPGFDVAVGWKDPGSWYGSPVTPTWGLCNWIHKLAGSRCRPGGMCLKAPALPANMLTSWPAGFLTTGLYGLTGGSR